MTKPITAGHAALDESKCPLSHCEPMGLIHGYAGVSQRRDHQAVPIRQHLIVQAWSNALAACRKEFTPQAGKADVLIRLTRIRLAVVGVGRVAGAWSQPLEPIEDSVSVKISARRHVITVGKKVNIVGT